MRIAVVGSLAAALLTLAGPARALRPEVVQAVALYEDLRFDEARAAFERAMRLEDNRADDLAAIHLHLGLLHGAEDREEQAEEHFRMALAVDPMVELPAGQPPKITRPFARAREFWGGARLRIEHEVPPGWMVGRPADLRFEALDDRLDLVTAARLTLWQEGEGDEEETGRRSYRQDGGGPFVFPVPPQLLEEEGRIRYRVELLGPASSILLVLDREELAVEVGPTPPPETRQRVIIRTAEPPPPRPIWEQWWFWTVIGVVVAGAAAGTTAALLVPGEGLDFGPPLLD